MSQTLLARLIKFMFALIVCAFLYVLFSSLNGFSDNDLSNKKTQDEETAFNTLAVGQTILTRVSNKRVWLSRISQQQKIDLKSLSPYVMNPNSGCSIDQALCALAAATNRSGIELRYSSARPPKLASGVAWYGGFVNPINGAMYDLLGRAYLGSNNDNNRPLEVITLD